MSLTDLAATIDAAWEARADIGISTQGAVREAVEQAIEMLDAGEARVAEKVGADWVVHTSARAGSSRTNSMCFSRALALVVTTTPAPRDRPDSIAEASVSVASSVRWLDAARICASMRERSSEVRLPTSIIASTKKRRPRSVGSRPAEVWGA